MSNKILKSERLYLRPVNITDSAAIFGYRSDSIANQYQGWIPKTIGDVTEFIDKVASTINTPDTWFQFVILQNENHQLIGDIGIHFTDKDNQQVEIGCTLNKTFQGNGYAAEALKIVITYLFHDLNKHRIVTSIDPRNTKSIELVKRLGFRKEAHFIESIWMDGVWADDLVYAMLKNEWN